MSKSPKLTRWAHPAQRGGIDPTIPGVYKTAASTRPINEYWRYFDGHTWGPCCRSIDEADKKRRSRGAGLPVYWRGLAEQPQS